jgi:pyruvate/2-oxoacid:ferredoxin oxidoreductase beta subunit/Pyruvate/2-oxoacid:ferredoxin oxidoreductase gamma subunit
MTDKVGELPFCPGCGHTLLIKALDKAIVKLAPDPKKFVIVTDIGCIGLSCRHFTTSAFHGLHGRSITYACGLKLARPDLTVVTLMGDGGCGIGGTHLLNVARRNIGITLIVANNFNYGMTGGQHSVTTPSQGFTVTTPWGNVEAPMDIAGTAIAAGAPWAYRATQFDKDLPDVIVEAIKQPGFAMLDIWELCVAYYSTANQIRKKDLFDLIERHNFKLGQLVDNPRKEYTERYWELYEENKKSIRKKPSIEPKFESAVKGQTGIIIAGSAGQKVQSSASLFAQAAMFSGLSATQKNDYPITVMTGHSLSEIILSPDRIDYTGIGAPEYMVVYSEDGLKKVRATISGLPESSVIYADETLDLPETNAKVHRFPFIRVSKSIDRLSIGTVALATMLEGERMFPMDALTTAIRTFQKPKIAEVNVHAAEAGAGLFQSRAN